MTAGKRQVLSRLRDVCDEYMAVHQAGMAAMQARDFLTLFAAVHAERELLAQHRRLIEMLRPHYWHPR